MKPLCQFLASQRIWVLSFLEGFLEFVDLLRSELGSVPSLVQSHFAAAGAAVAAAASYAIGAFLSRQVVKHRVVDSGACI